MRIIRNNQATQWTVIFQVSTLSWMKDHEFATGHWCTKNNLLVFTWFGMPVPTSSNIWLDVHSRCAGSCKRREDEWEQDSSEPTSLSLRRTKLSSLACTASHGFSLSNGSIPPPGLLPLSATGIVSAFICACSWELGRNHRLSLFILWLTFVVPPWPPTWNYHCAHVCPHLILSSLNVGIVLLIFVHPTNVLNIPGYAKRGKISLNSTQLSADKGLNAWATQNWDLIYSSAVAWVEKNEPFRTLIGQKLSISHYAGGR